MDWNFKNQKPKKQEIKLSLQFEDSIVMSLIKMVTIERSWDGMEHLRWMAWDVQRTVWSPFGTEKWEKKLPVP